MYYFRLLTVLWIVTTVAIAADSPPNIILINIDDLGYGDTGPFGSTENSTPHLDRMGREGRLLKSHYAAPVCSPSRASLMTGSYPKRALPIQHVLFPSSSIGLHPNEVTVAEILKQAGYRTACIGKWHLGDQPEFLPTRQGFDYYFGFPYSNDMGPIGDGIKNNPGQPKPKTPNKPAPAEIPVDGIRGLYQPPLPLLENETVIERVNAAGQTTITQRYTKKATEFIRNNKSETFFLYLPHSAVHFPLYPGMTFRSKSGNGLFSDWVSEVDWSVGQILNTVRDLDLTERTLVIFTSDNGGATRHGANNAPLRGNKGQTLEGGIRVPTIAWWPGKIPAGTSTNAITSTMDILPTFAEIAGTPVPSDRKLDGISVWSVMNGSAGENHPRTSFHYFRGFRLEAVRSGPWKLHLKNGELYNLDDDVGESRNVAGNNAEIVQKLRIMADEMTADLGDGDIGPGCRPAGTVKDPQPLIDVNGKFRL